MFKKYSEITDKNLIKDSFDETKSNSSEVSDFVIEELTNAKYNVESKTWSILYLIKEYIVNETTMKLRIPIYQRKYVWNKEIFNQFYNDIFELALANSQDNFHYIGEISLSKNQKDTKAYNVVDGQQRITSILLVMRAIYDYANFHEYKIDLRTRKLFKYDHEGVLAHRKFQHIKDNDDFDVLEKILNGKFNEIKNSEKKATSVYKNFLNILQHLGMKKNKNDELASDENIYNQDEIKAILKTFYTKIIFTEIIHETNEEHLLFEALNSNKALLENIDLIKNYIIMKIDDNEINQNEQGILESFDNDIMKPFKKNTKINSFLTVYSKLYLIETRKAADIKDLDIVKNAKGINYTPNIWPIFKWIIDEQINKTIKSGKDKMDFQEYKQLIAKMNKEIRLFTMLLDKEQYSSYGTELFALQDILSIFTDRTVYIPVLMFLISKFSEYKDEKLIIPKNNIKKLRELLFAFEKFEVILKFVMRSNESLTVFMDTVLEKISLRYLLKKDQLSHDDILESFKEADSKHAWNDEKVDLLYEEVTNKQRELLPRAKYFFCKRIEYFLDNGLTLDFARDRKNSTDDIKKPSIEHIMPQNINNEDWDNYLSSKYPNKNKFEIENEHKKSLNRLGNLMLINENVNSQFGNKLFADKKYEATSVADLHQFKGSQHVMEKLKEKLQQKFKDDSRVNDELSKLKGYNGVELKLTHLRDHENLKENQKWDFEAIDKRTKELANILHYIYKEIKW